MKEHQLKSLPHTLSSTPPGATSFCGLSGICGSAACGAPACLTSLLEVLSVLGLFILITLTSFCLFSLLVSCISGCPRVLSLALFSVCTSPSKSSHFRGLRVASTFQWAQIQSSSPHLLSSKPVFPALTWTFPPIPPRCILSISLMRINTFPDPLPAPTPPRLKILFLFSHDRLSCSVVALFAGPPSWQPQSLHPFPSLPLPCVLVLQ